MVYNKYYIMILNWYIKKCGHHKGQEPHREFKVTSDTLFDS